MTGFHVADGDLRAWAEDRLGEPAAWSVEAHLDSCRDCRSRVPATPAVPGAPTVLPVQGRVRRPTPARRVRLLLGAGPQARLAWFSAVAVTVALTLLVATQPAGTVPHWMLLLVAPLLPVLGTAVSYGRHTDPLYEMVASSAYGGLRIILWRTLSVLAVSLPVTGAGGLVSGLGVPAVWLLPALALTATTLALASPVGPVPAASVVAGCWFLLVTATLWSRESGAQLVGWTASPAWLTVLVAAAVVMFVRKTREARR
ncbi:zf-HC2 domain-containing protein [Actinoplanes sp. G11-F43]|uniref:zf-HC2 domain-containing protein n=1 Tax=Actinoplanes sp. G11-F43 TaxID=3424130 RepID=UPI003D34F2B5